MKEYDIVYSIGRDCANSFFLKKMKLRLTSGPFDWMIVPSFEKRVDIICSNFENFLNKEDLERVPKPQHTITDTYCDPYRNNYTGALHPHDFTTGIPFDEMYPVVKEKYDRRIARFLHNLQTKEDVLLVWFSHEPQDSEEHLLEQCYRLCRHFNRNFDFLLIEHDANLPKGKVVKHQLAENITRYTLYTQVMKNGYLTTHGRKKKILPLYSKVCIKGKLNERRKARIYRIIGRILSSVAPLRSWRQAIRRRFKL